MKGCLRWLIPIVILLLWVALLMANLLATELPVFFQASANSLLSSLIVLAVSYWLVQARIDSRKDDDVVTNILNRAENSFIMNDKNNMKERNDPFTSEQERKGIRVETRLPVYGGGLILYTVVQLCLRNRASFRRPIRFAWITRSSCRQ